MLFNSYVFIFAFLPVALAGYLAAGRFAGRAASFAWLVAASLFYYGWWNPSYLALLGFSLVFNYAVGLMLRPRERSGQRSRLTALWIGVGVNLGLLGYFKYANFFVDSVDALLGAGWSIPPIVLPLAISFFTFQQIAYLVDSYRNETHEYRFVDYCLFVTFFPQLIAGPIVHHKEMLPQFSARARFRLRGDDLATGLSIFSIGLFKKVVIADTLATFATPVFDTVGAGNDAAAAEAWIAALAYTLQLYFDFSGYSDMAVGLARLFGIRLPLNFNSPYKAVNIADFWRRWHITLSRFLRDYLYIPLGGNRKGESRRLANLMITMLLGGLWHGAGWTFVVWGGLHGLYLVIQRVWSRFWADRLSLGPIGSFCARASAQAVTLLAVVVGWVFFRATSFDSAASVLRSMAGLGGEPGLERIAMAQGATWVVIAGLIALFAPNVANIFAEREPVVDMQAHGIRPPKLRLLVFRPGLVWAAITAALFTYATLSLSNASEFLYFQF